jgi:peroxin-5
MGMGGYMGGMGGMGMMRPMGMQSPMMQQPMEGQTQDKGKGRMVELDDENWEAQFAEMETAGNETQTDEEANAAMEAELNELDRSVPTSDDAFESVWERIQAETATSRKLVEEGGDFEVTDSVHVGDLGDWEGFDSLNTRFRDPQLGDYMFEEDNVYSAVIGCAGLRSCRPERSSARASLDDAGLRTGTK